ncbi:hypothetical protein RI054_37g141040 [Pseudoscourfieldia marina]
MGGEISPNTLAARDAIATLATREARCGGGSTRVETPRTGRARGSSGSGGSETSTPAPLPLATAPSQEAGDPTADDGALHANGLAFTDDYDDAQLPPDPPHPDEVLETQLPLPGISQPAGVSASQPAGVSTSQPVGTLPSGTLPRCPFNWHACELFAAMGAMSAALCDDTPSWGFGVDPA